MLLKSTRFIWPWFRANRWGSPFIHISATNATPISMLAIRRLTARASPAIVCSAEERRMQAIKRPLYPLIMSVCEGLLASGADLAAQ